MVYLRPVGAFTNSIEGESLEVPEAWKCEKPTVEYWKGVEAKSASRP